MSQDPLLKYFKKLRNDIEKRGREGTTHVTVVDSFSTSDIPPPPSSDIPPPPSNAIGFFVGDQNGGNGWEVQLEDGSIEKIYIALPEDKMRSWLAFEDLPSEHLEAPIEDGSLENVCRLYVRYLQRLVVAAEARFGKVS
jgi:hypothetical protein